MRITGTEANPLVHEHITQIPESSTAEAGGALSMLASAAEEKEGEEDEEARVSDGERK